jgi:L-seryl-tRNA(Ser) seleniumtransferase
VGKFWGCVRWALRYPIGMETTNPFRLLPKVDEVLASEGVAALEASVGRDLLRALVQEILSDWRVEIADGVLDGEALGERLANEGAPGGLVARLHAAVAEEHGRGIVPAVNGTGIVLHTGLGRAPVHAEAASAMAAAAGGFCVVEVDRFSGQRNRRDDRLSELATRLIGCEAAIAVNNNAAACVLALTTFAAGKETITSHGELVEIGGSFRMPDVMEQAGTKLVAVGSTNRTRIGDYQKALGDETGLLLKVHRSNFAVIGFTEEATMEDIASLAKANGLPSVYDLGAGFLNRGVPGLTPIDGLRGETLLDDAIASGADVVSFSGDKLFGGPQAGILAGNRGAIEDMRKHPLYRAMRLDKVSLAGLERTFELYLEGRGDEIPSRAMLSRTLQDLDAAAKELHAAMCSLPVVVNNSLTLEIVASTSQPGSGSAPGVEIPTTCLRVKDPSNGAGELADRLRAATPPVFVRVSEDALWIDLRTLLPGDDKRLITAFESLG